MEPTCDPYWTRKPTLRYGIYITLESKSFPLRACDPGSALVVMIVRERRSKTRVGLLGDHCEPGSLPATLIDLLPIDRLRAQVLKGLASSSIQDDPFTCNSNLLLGS